MVEAEREAQRPGRGPEKACLTWTSSGQALIVLISNEQCLKTVLCIASNSISLPGLPKNCKGFRQVNSNRPIKAQWKSFLATTLTDRSRSK